MRIFRRRWDLPLRHDATSRYLPWLVALMVFLSALALAGMFVLSGVVERWNRDVSGTVTVQVAPAAGKPEEAERATAERVERALRYLHNVAGVVAARALDRAELVALVKPWLGDAGLLQDLPMPRLIDVTVDARAPPDLDQLARNLAEAVPGASLDDHGVWLSRLIELSRAVEALAAVVVLLIGAATAATVVYATRTGMAVHAEVIDLLHQMGAEDDYVARQFAERAFQLGLRGGLLGLALAVPALSLLGWTAGHAEGGLVPPLTLSVSGWLAIALLPALAGALALATAWATVRRSLGRLP